MVSQPDRESRGTKWEAKQSKGSAGATARRHSTRERTGRQREASIPTIHLSALAPHSVPQPFPFLASTPAGGGSDPIPGAYRTESSI
ncbi:unnamed protein product [Urochloa humidicola]